MAKSLSWEYGEIFNVSTKSGIYLNAEKLIYATGLFYLIFKV